MKNKFNVIIERNNNFEPYDILGYLSKVWSSMSPSGRSKACKDIKGWIDGELKYMFWGRCEYELILSDWPCEKVKEKIDIYWQASMNINIITKLFCENEKIS